MQKHAHLVDLVKSFPTSILAKFGCDTAENEPLKVHFISHPWDSIFTKPPRPSRSDEPRTRSGRLVKAPQAFLVEDDEGYKRTQIRNHVGEGVTLGSLPTFQLLDVDDGVLRRLLCLV